MVVMTFMTSRTYALFKMCVRSATFIKDHGLDP